MFPYARKTYFEGLEELYPAAEFTGSTFRQRKSWLGDAVVRCPAYYLARAVADWVCPVWKMRWNTGGGLLGSMKGVIFNVSYEGMWTPFVPRFPAPALPRSYANEDIPPNGDFTYSLLDPHLFPRRKPHHHPHYQRLDPLLHNVS
ncbi:hypothetical protein K432DRAFT_376871 [Lepidopterella palustris CBS 459.81]|uniref:Uncharacterized protein n=1 Tax=Lepidopterella palustris CBS 459.81 TaxID=1314670 RepID=A0A8E2JL34_9PEZI|nr:hypothetical protein K432DRAFT_376871 [Lepidopterella palustris CBS 459.81]